MEGTVQNENKLVGSLQNENKLEGSLSSGNSMAGGMVAVFGKDGKSAYEVWLGEGNTGTEADFLDSLRGKDGDDGETPCIGENGNWFIGEIDTGEKAHGDDGTSISITRVEERITDDNGFLMTKITFSDGTEIKIPSGPNGKDGDTPERGTDYWTEEDKTEIVNDVLEEITVPDGGGGLFVTTITGNATNGYTTDHTSNEIITAFKSGKVCVARSGAAVYHLSSFVEVMNTVTFSYSINTVSIVGTKATFATTSAYVSITGDTMRGMLTLQGDPQSELHAATKRYVDNAIDNINLPTESWTFELEDGSTVTKNVVVK